MDCGAPTARSALSKERSPSIPCFDWLRPRAPAIGATSAEAAIASLRYLQRAPAARVAYRADRVLHSVQD